jgi:hypothetical protein
MNCVLKHWVGLIYSLILTKVRIFIPKKVVPIFWGATSQQCKASVWSTHLLIRVSSVSQKRTKEAMFLLFLGREDAVQRFLSFENMKHPTTKLRD